MSIEKGTRTRFATLLILLLVLVTGSVLGIAADRRLQTRSPRSEDRSREVSGRSQRDRGEEQSVDSTSSRNRRGLIVEQVGLTEIQHARVDSIVTHYRRRMGELQEELEAELRQAYQPRYRELLEQTREDIRSVLTIEQRAAYDSLLVEYDRRRDQHREQDSISDSTRGQRE